MYKNYQDLLKNNMTGEDLIKFIENNNSLKYLPISYTIKELLKRDLINPSTLIDAQKELLEEQIHRYKSHYTDAVVSSKQILDGNFKGEYLEDAKKRFQYNTSFCKTFPKVNNLTEEENKKFSDNFELCYGFRPEDYE